MRKVPDERGVVIRTKNRKLFAVYFSHPAAQENQHLFCVVEMGVSCPRKEMFF